LYSLDGEGRSVATRRGGNVHVNGHGFSQAQLAALRVVLEYRQHWCRGSLIGSGVQHTYLPVEPSARQTAADSQQKVAETATEIDTKKRSILQLSRVRFRCCFSDNS